MSEQLMDLSISVENKEKERHPSEGLCIKGTNLGKLSLYKDIRQKFGIYV